MSAYEAVQITQFRAKDGSLHGSAEAARRHDEAKAVRMLRAEVFYIVQSATWSSFHLSPVCGYQHMHKNGEDSSFERDMINEAIADLIIDHWAELKKVIKK